MKQAWPLGGSSAGGSSRMRRTLNPKHQAGQLRRQPGGDSPAACRWVCQQGVSEVAVPRKEGEREQVPRGRVDCCMPRLIRSAGWQCPSRRHEWRQARKRRRRAGAPPARTAHLAPPPPLSLTHSHNAPAYQYPSHLLSHALAAEPCRSGATLHALAGARAHRTLPPLVPEGGLGSARDEGWGPRWRLDHPRTSPHPSHAPLSIPIARSWCPRPPRPTV